MSTPLAAAEREVQQDQVGWHDPELVYEGSEGVLFSDPDVAADSSQRPHVFWTVAGRVSDGVTSSLPGEVLNSVRVADNWEAPVDVIASSDASPLLRVKVILDHNGDFQAIMNGALGAAPEYWTYSESQEAHGALAWSSPEPISHDVAYDGDITVDSANNTHVLYAVTGAAMQTESRALYHIALSEDSTFWSAPNLVAPATEERGIAETRMAIDSFDCIHAIWTETPLTGYPPTSVLYAQSCDSGQSWTNSVELFGPDLGNPRIAVSDQGVLHVVALARVGKPGSYHTWSANRGLTWMPVDTIEPIRQGLSGAGLGIDSSGNVHFAYVGASQQEVLVTSWADGAWTASRPISSPVQLAPGRMFEEVSLAVVQGNRILVAYREHAIAQAEEGITRIWFVEGKTDATETPAVLTPKSRKTATASLTKEVGFAVVPTPISVSSATVTASIDARPAAQANTAYPIVVSTFLSGTLVVAALMWRAYRVGRR